MRFLVEYHLVIPILALLAGLLLMSRGFLIGTRERPGNTTGRPPIPDDGDPNPGQEEPRTRNMLTRDDVRFLFTMPKGTGFNDLPTLSRKMYKEWGEDYGFTRVRTWLERAKARGLVEEGGNTGWWMTEAGTEALRDALRDPIGVLWIRQEDP
ncbi:MAG: hypothetical protein UY95_C0033G0008 [Parcubacteria group bacterium GW2011_GWA2_56_7]|nr:MAG: hypothetical protein UY95_C0033G0008 [Parcubacteria group bacterium GW2011_GWA2_56_7]